MLRRLLVLALACGCLGAPAARAGTVAIFYYPWYGTPAADGAWQHWDQNGHRPPGDVYSRYYPAGGPYSSDRPSVLRRQMRQIAAAGVDEVVVSWWGRGSLEDQRLPRVLAAAARRGLRTAIHLEPYEGRSPASVLVDLQYLASLGIRDVYVYHPHDLATADWVAVRAQAPATLRLYAGTHLVGFAAAAGFDGFYTYDFVDFGGDEFVRLCAEAHALHLRCAPSVGPGYDGLRAGETSSETPRRNGVTYDHLWDAALAAQPDQVTITSYNEWGEGTQIEPAVRRHGYRGYDGAWGLRGRRARRAYLLRTAYWANRFHNGAPTAPYTWRGWRHALCRHPSRSCRMR